MSTACDQEEQEKNADLEKAEALEKSRAVLQGVARKTGYDGAYAERAWLARETEVVALLKKNWKQEKAGNEQQVLLLAECGGCGCPTNRRVLTNQELTKTTEDANYNSRSETTSGKPSRLAQLLLVVLQQQQQQQQPPPLSSMTAGCMNACVTLSLIV